MLHLFYKASVSLPFSGHSLRAGNASPVSRVIIGSLSALASRSQAIEIETYCSLMNALASFTYSG